MLTLVSSTNLNNDAASLQAAGGPGDPSMPGFANLGIGSTGNSSVTYLGGGWVLTAGHVTIANVVTGSPGGVTFAGTHYNVDESSITFLHNSDNSVADLKVFKMIGDPGLPSIIPSLIDSSTASGRQIMIGDGLSLDLANQQYWSVNTSNPNNYVWTSKPSPTGANASGFNIVDSRAVRWGENDPLVNAAQQTETSFPRTADATIIVNNQPQSVQTFTHGYFTQFDNLTYTGVMPRASEAQASSGDSGGPVFSLVGTQWQLSGIMDEVFILQNQPNPTTTAVFGDQTFITDLSAYRTEILAITSSVVARNLFYAGSPRYDTTGNPQTPLPFSDDNAIATNKSAYLPGSGSATYANLSNYDRGINGIMVDLQGGGTHSAIQTNFNNLNSSILNDFTFKVGNDNSPGAWAAAPLPISVTVRPGAGVSGSDRVELVWADNAIQQEWIEVTVLATADTGLAANDVFFFGSEIGNTGISNTANSAQTGVNDVSDVVNHGANSKNNIPVTNIYDFNRDGLVAVGDVSDAVNHGTNSKNGLVFISIGSGGPFAPEVVPTTTTTSSDTGIASALASTSSGQLPALPAIPPWIASRFAQLDLNHGSIAKYLTHLAHENAATAKTILVAAEQVAESLNLDDSLLHSLLVRLGSE